MGNVTLDATTAGSFSVAGPGAWLAEKGTFTVTGNPAGIVLVAETGEFELNKESAGFGSFVTSKPVTRLYVTKADGRYVSSQGYYVTLDILEGTSFSRSTNPTDTHTRVAVVTDMNDSDDMDAAEIQLEAMYAVMELTGDIGSRHPSIGRPNYIEKFIPELMDQHSARVKILYRAYPLPEYEFDAGLGSIETNVDHDGDPIEVSYTYPNDYLLDSRKAGRTITQGGMVSRPISESIITVHFTITAGFLPTLVVDGQVVSFAGYASATMIMTTLQKFHAHVNDAAFYISNLYCAYRTVIVERVKGRSRDGGHTYQASFTIKHKPQGIEQPATFINSDDGLPPADLVEGTGYYTPEVLGECTIPDFLFNNPMYWTYGEDWEWQ